MHTITRTRKVIVEGDRSKDKRVLSCNTYHKELFLLYINDIDTYICSSIHLFADDCILYRIIESLKHLKTINTWLYCDLNSLIQWTTQWQMKLNQL